MIRETCFAVSSSGNQDKEEDHFFTSKTFHTISYLRKDEKIITCAFFSENHSSNKCSNVTDISLRLVLEKIISRKTVSQTTSVTNANCDIIFLFVLRTPKSKTYTPKKIKIKLCFKVLLFV